MLKDWPSVSRMTVLVAASLAPREDVSTAFLAVDNARSVWVEPP